MREKNNQKLVWLSDVFQVVVTLCLIAVLFEIIRPGTFSAAINLVAVAIFLVVFGVVFVCLKVDFIGKWLTNVDIALLAVILWVVPNTGSVSRIVTVIVVALACVLYLRKSQEKV